jgi:hypothetical protein
MGGLLEVKGKVHGKVMCALIVSGKPVGGCYRIPLRRKGGVTGGHLIEVGRKRVDR